MMRTTIAMLVIGVALGAAPTGGPAYAADPVVGAPATPGPQDVVPNRPGGAVRARNGIDVTGKPAGPGDRTGNDSRVNSWQDTPAKTGLGNAEGPVGANGAGLGVGGNGRRPGNDPGPANAAGSGVGTGKPGPAANQ